MISNILLNREEFDVGSSRLWRISKIAETLKSQESSNVSSSHAMSIRILLSSHFRGEVPELRISPEPRQVTDVTNAICKLVGFLVLLERFWAAINGGWPIREDRVKRS